MIAIWEVMSRIKRPKPSPDFMVRLCYCFWLRAEAGAVLHFIASGLDSRLGPDRISVFTETRGLKEQTLEALQAAANIRWTNDSNYERVNQKPFFKTNSKSVMDTMIWYTHGTTTPADDGLVMVLEDFTTPLSFGMFEVF